MTIRLNDASKVSSSNLREDKSNLCATQTTIVPDSRIYFGLELCRNKFRSPSASFPRFLEKIPSKHIRALKSLAWRLALSLFILAVLAGPGAELLRQVAAK